jgi:hypothetical protein
LFIMIDGIFEKHKLDFVKYALKSKGTKIVLLNSPVFKFYRSH